MFNRRSLPRELETPTAYGVPIADSSGKIADGWLSSAIARISDLTWTNISGKPSTFAPSAHASSHKHGGSDEVATATPGANAIPKAGAAGTLADGWLSAAIARVADITTHAAVKDGVHGLSNAGAYTLTIPATGTAALREAANLFSAAQTLRVTDAATTTTATVAAFEHFSSGTPGAGFGVDLLYNAESDTANRNMALDRFTWVVATDASRRARRSFYAFDTVARECIRIEASGTAPMVGFNGVAAVARQAITALSMSVGSGDNTVVDVGASFNQTTLNNNFRDVVNKINELRTILVNVGIAV